MKFVKFGGWNEGHDVAPLVGAWIEIVDPVLTAVVILSLPSWERGLKSYEIRVENNYPRRSPRGSVD